MAGNQVLRFRGERAMDRYEIGFLEQLIQLHFRLQRYRPFPRLRKDRRSTVVSFRS